MKDPFSERTFHKLVQAGAVSLFFGEKPQIFYVFVWRTKIFSCNDKKTMELMEIQLLDSKELHYATLAHFNLIRSKPLILMF